MTRRAAVVKVQIARKELGLDEDTYRAMLERITGRTSSADCTDDQLGDVLDEMKAKGWKPKVVAGGRSGRPIRKTAPASSPVAKKARALWLSLHHLGVVREPSEPALEAFARRQLGVDRLHWADESQGYRLIEALKAMAEREGWSQDVSGYPPRTDLVKVLKAGLIRAQEKRLGRPRSPENYMRRLHPELDRVIREQGAEIHALQARAG
ncbi:MAG: regulatory protein GemA [Brevundimonas sp.]|uniref:gp16 family protein n=1 Tax=Brevundimonas sp. TaxID=1871086 RepID=UPI001A2C95CC|nr:regulatory protein GemA [Brevundimonas sp.]MBJ7318259.1 regulatory protein GemA [Brevundimonas sp.]